jgi:hypothetical protein
MAGGVTIQVKGFEELQKKLGKFPENLSIELDAGLGNVAQEYETKAAEAVPIDTGFLKTHITALKVSHLNYEVVSGAPYSAYVEFGTITRVVVPSDLVEYAAQFKGRGIRKTGGMYPQPFFFPHLPWAKAESVRVAEKVINKGLNR